MATIKKDNVRKKRKKKWSSSYSIRKKERQAIYNTSKWIELRTAYLMEHPLCEKCLAEGKINADKLEIHHKDSFMNYDGNERLEKAYDYNNLQTLCQYHHLEVHGLLKKKDTFNDDILEEIKKAEEEEKLRQEKIKLLQNKK